MWQLRLSAFPLLSSRLMLLLISSSSLWSCLLHLLSCSFAISVYPSKKQSGSPSVDSWRRVMRKHLQREGEDFPELYLWSPGELLVLKFFFSWQLDELAEGGALGAKNVQPRSKKTCCFTPGSKMSGLPVARWWHWYWDDFRTLQLCVHQSTWVSSPRCDDLVIGIIVYSRLILADFMFSVTPSFQRMMIRGTGYSTLNEWGHPGWTEVRPGARSLI